MEIKPIKVKATAMWANLTEVNEMSGKYQVDLCNLSPAAVKALEGMGIEVKKGTGDKEDKGYFITCKSQNPIKAFDEAGDAVNERVGNGTEVAAVIGAYSWTWKNKKGTSPSLKKLVITKLVKYVTEEADVDDVDGVGSLEEDVL